MKAIIQVVIETELGPQMQEVACLERKEHCLENIGLTLAESKSLLLAAQKMLIDQQIAEYLEARRHCPHCGEIRHQKGSHTVSLQTLFGNLKINSPRWNHCPCQPTPAQTFSPLTELLRERVSPERLYLEVKWSSLISFKMAALLLKDALPVAETVNAASVRNDEIPLSSRSPAKQIESRHHCCRDSSKGGVRVAAGFKRQRWSLAKGSPRFSECAQR
jgi:hypothetical protein